MEQKGSNNKNLAFILIGVAVVGTATAILLLRKKSAKQETPLLLATIPQSEVQEEVAPAPKKDTKKLLTGLAIATGVAAVGFGIGEILSKKQKAKQSQPSAYSPASKLAPKQMSGSKLLG